MEVDPVPFLLAEENEKEAENENENLWSGKQHSYSLSFKMDALRNLFMREREGQV